MILENVTKNARANIFWDSDSHLNVSARQKFSIFAKTLLFSRNLSFELISKSNLTGFSTFHSRRYDNVSGIQRGNINFGSRIERDFV